MIKSIRIFLSTILLSFANRFWVIGMFYLISGISIKIGIRICNKHKAISMLIQYYSFKSFSYFIDRIEITSYCNWLEIAKQKRLSRKILLGPEVLSPINNQEYYCNKNAYYSLCKFLSRLLQRVQQQHCNTRKISINI